MLDEGRDFGRQMCSVNLVVKPEKGRVIEMKVDRLRNRIGEIVM